jgi:hypothetical protein
LNYLHFLTQENIGFKLSEIMVGSGIRKKPVPDPGSRGQKGTGSRIRIRNTGICIEIFERGKFYNWPFCLRSVQSFEHMKAATDPFKSK